MAAGIGSRLAPFTDTHPKATLPILGVPAIQFGVDVFRSFGIDRFVVNVHHQADRLREDLARRIDWQGAVWQESDESSLLLGSAGALARARPCFSGRPFFYSNADRLWELDLHGLESAHLRNRSRFGAWLTLAVHAAAPAGAKYREIGLGEGGVITSIGDFAERRPFFMGIAVIEPEAIAEVRDDQASEFVPEILERAIQLKRAGYFLTQGRWLDMDSPPLWAESQFHLLESLESGDLPHLWRRRIESANRRHGPGVWASRRMPMHVDLSGCEGPVYLDLDRWPARISAGPRAILYGDLGDGAESTKPSRTIRHGLQTATTR